jgi:hypothetical protein
VTIKINEIGTIHNMFMNIFHCVINTYGFDVVCPPEPVRENLIEQCTCQVVPIYLVQLVSLTTDVELRSKLQIWADDCISAQTIIRMSFDDKKIESACKAIYDTTVVLAEHVDDMIQKIKPDWIEETNELSYVLFTEKICDYDGVSGKLAIPTVCYNGKFLASYQKMFWYMKQEYN